MSKDEFLKIQTTVLKVNIHCDGCEKKVKKILQKIDGVYTIKIDSEHGKVTVSGSITADAVIKKLSKAGKRAEVWSPAKPPNNKQNNTNPQTAGGKGNKGDQPPNDHGGVPQTTPQWTPQQLQQLQKMQQATPQWTPQQLQQLQKLQQMQQLKDPRLAMAQNSNQKPVNAGDGDSDDFDDSDVDDDEYGDEFDDEEEEIPVPLNKTKQAGHAPNMPLHAQNPQLLNALNNMKMANVGAHGGGSSLPASSNTGKNGKPGKNVGNPSGAVGGNDKNAKVAGYPNTASPHVPQMLNHPPAAVQGFPATGVGGNYYQRPEPVAGNPYNQQQMSAMMMNQQRASGNERFHPMMYARPPPAVTYMPPPYPYPYPYAYGYHPPPSDNFSLFSDENTWSCSIM